MTDEIQKLVENAGISDKYVKKPVTIRAFQITKKIHNDIIDGSDVNMPKWVNDAIGKELTVKNGDIMVQTLESDTDKGTRHLLSPDDWLIEGVDGELYPCKPDIFRKTYEKAK